MYADSHAHLSMPAFDEDLVEVLDRAKEAGVDRIMTCATSMADAEKNLAIAREHSERGLLASAGFHPHQAKEWNDDSEASLVSLIEANPQIRAIGEVGLDFHYNFSAVDVQRDVLRRQVGLARERKLPLIIHCREAREDLQTIILEEKASEAGGVLHCFSEDADFARFCVDQGFYVSFSGIVTFKTAETLREAAKVVPADRLLVETDSPYLAPVPHRGRRNEPAYVADVARFVTDLRQEESLPIRENFEVLFSRAG